MLERSSHSPGSASNMSGQQHSLDEPSSQITTVLEDIQQCRFDGDPAVLVALAEEVDNGAVWRAGR
jgi:hypothetical protein